jgi:hypothetical protein
LDARRPNASADIVHIPASALGGCIRRKPLPAGQQLTEKDAKKILTDSPWSQKTTFVEWPSISSLDETAAEMTGNLGPRSAISGPRGYGLEKGSGAHGEKEVYFTYTCRLFSAVPVRQAHVGIWRADSKYDKMTPAQKEAFDNQVSPFLPSGYGGTVADLLNGGTQAAAGGGMFDPWSKPIRGYIVFIGSGFWGLSPGNRESGLIEEALHNAKWNTFTDSYLANLLTGKTYSSESEASKDLTKELDAKCGN